MEETHHTHKGPRDKQYTRGKAFGKRCKTS